MCFSASASFTTSFLLMIIGIFTARTVNQSRLYYIATMPLFFSIQQAAEGFVWLSLLGNISPVMQQAAVYIFLFFAIGVWPFWIPFSLMNAEVNLKSKKILTFLSFLGMVVSLSLLMQLFYYHTTAAVAHCHISYDFLTNLTYFTQFLYAISYIFMVTIPFFISTIRYMKLFGSGIVISCALSYYFYYYTVGSVWCFFAALLSLGIYFIVDQEQRKFIAH